MKIYFPSNFGDINIEQNNENVMLSTVNLTVHEEKILKEIVKKFYHDKAKEPVKSYENTIIILANTKIEDVHKFMIKKLKKNKPTLTAIKLRDGNLELADNITEEHIKKSDKAITTEKPRRGCPMPEMTMVKEVRASNILKEFLTEEQLKDFTEHKSFVSIGNYTKHPYLIISRWNPKIEEFGQVYDLVEKYTLCISCKDIPPSEEMLAMKLSVELNELDFLKTPLT